LNFRHENEICPIDGGGCPCDIFIYRERKIAYIYVVYRYTRVCKLFLFNSALERVQWKSFMISLVFFYDRKGVNEHDVCVCVSPKSSKRCRSRRHTISRRFRLTRLLLLLLLLSSHAWRRHLLCIRLLLWLSAGHVFPTAVDYQTLLRPS